MKLILVYVTIVSVTVNTKDQLTPILPGTWIQDVSSSYAKQLINTNTSDCCVPTSFTVGSLTEDDAIITYEFNQSMVGTAACNYVGITKTSVSFTSSYLSIDIEGFLAWVSLYNTECSLKLCSNPGKNIELGFTANTINGTILTDVIGLISNALSDNKGCTQTYQKVFSGTHIKMTFSVTLFLLLSMITF